MFPNTIYSFFFFHDIWHSHFLLLAQGTFLYSLFFFLFHFLFLLSMDHLKAKHGEPSKGEGSLRCVTKTVTCRSFSALPPSTTSILIVDNEEQDVLIEGFSASQWKSKAIPRTPEKLSRDYHIPASVELKIPSPNEHMATPHEGCVALYPFLFKAKVSLPSHHFIHLFLRSLNVALA